LLLLPAAACGEVCGPVFVSAASKCLNYAG